MAWWRHAVAGPPRSRAGRAGVVFVMLVVLVGCWYRLDAWATSTAKYPASLLEGTDEGNYLRVAKKISDGKVATDDVSNAVSYRSVVFPLLGVPVLKAFDFDGRGVKYARLAVALFGLFTCLLGAYITLRFFDLRHAGWAAAAALVLLLFNSQLGLWASTFMPDGVAVGLFLASIVALRGLYRADRPRPFAGVAVGALLALTALVKFDFVYLNGAFVGYSLVVGWLAGRGSPRRERLRRAATVAIAGAVFALALVAYGLRNRAHTGTFFITSKDTVNLWIGNNPYATGGYMWSPKWTDPDPDHASEPVDEAHLQATRTYLAPKEQRVLDDYLRSMSSDDRTATQRRLAKLAPADAAKTLRDLLVTLSPELHDDAVRALLTKEELEHVEAALRGFPRERRTRAEAMIAQLRPQDAVRFIRSQRFAGGGDPVADVKALLAPGERAELERILASASDQALSFLTSMSPEAAVVFLRRSVLRPTPETLASGILKLPHHDIVLRDQYRRRFYHYLASQPLGFARGLLHKLWLFASHGSVREFAVVGGASPVISYGLELAVLAGLAAFLLGKWGRTRRFEIGLLFLAYFAELGVLVLVFVDSRLLLLNMTLATLIGVAFLADLLERCWPPRRPVRDAMTTAASAA